VALVWNGTAGNGFVNSGTTTQSFTAVGMGTASSDRINVLFIGYAVGNPIVGVTVGGVAATQVPLAIASSSPNQNCEIWYIANPTGTTANIVVTTTSSTFGCNVNVGALTGANSTPGTVQVASTNALATATFSAAAVTIPTGGICLMAMQGSGAGGV
jgi:hypothetical protein